MSFVEFCLLIAFVQVRVLLHAHPGIPSTTRWTSMQPAFAYAALWQLVNQLGWKALSRAYSEPAAAAAAHPDDDTNAWQRVYGQRLKRCFHFMAAPSMLRSCVLATLVGNPIQHALVWVLKMEAKYSPELLAALKRVRRKVRKNMITPTVTAGNEMEVSTPLPLQLAGGQIIGRILWQGATVLLPELPDSEIPVAPHVACVAAFRHLFAPSPGSEEFAQLVVQTWRCLLPGLTQLWFRFFHSWRNRYPQRLLQMLVVDDDQERQQLACELLELPKCCVDVGFSAVLRDVAQAEFVDHQDQVRFLCSPYVQAIIKYWSEAASPSIADIECVNASIKRSRCEGRPEHFARSAAKATVREAVFQFRRAHGREPRDCIKVAADALFATLDQGTRSNKGGAPKHQRSGWQMWLREQYKHLKETLHTTDRRAVFFSGAEVKKRLAETWRTLSWEQRAEWDMKAKLENAERVKARADAAQAAHHPQPPPPASRLSYRLMGDAFSILTEDEYKSVLGANALAPVENWAKWHNLPFGARTPGALTVPSVLPGVQSASIAQPMLPPPERSAQGSGNSSPGGMEGLPQAFPERALGPEQQADLDDPKRPTCGDKLNCQRYSKRVRDCGRAAERQVATAVRSGAVAASQPEAEPEQDADPLSAWTVVCSRGCGAVSRSVLLLGHMLFNPRRVLFVECDLDEETSVARIHWNDRASLCPWVFLSVYEALARLRVDGADVLDVKLHQVSITPVAWDAFRLGNFVGPSGTLFNKDSVRSVRHRPGPGTCMNAALTALSRALQPNTPLAMLPAPFADTAQQRDLVPAETGEVRESSDSEAEDPPAQLPAQEQQELQRDPPAEWVVEAIRMELDQADSCLASISGQSIRGGAEGSAGGATGPVAEAQDNAGYAQVGGSSSSSGPPQGAAGAAPRMITHSTDQSRIKQALGDKSYRIAWDNGYRIYWEARTPYKLHGAEMITPEICSHCLLDCKDKTPWTVRCTLHRELAQKGSSADGAWVKYKTEGRQRKLSLRCHQAGLCQPFDASSGGVSHGQTA